MDYFEMLQNIIHRFNAAPCYRKISTSFDNTTGKYKVNDDSRKRILVADNGWYQRVEMTSEHGHWQEPGRKGGLRKYIIDPDLPFTMGVWGTNDMAIDPQLRTIGVISRYVPIASDFYRHALSYWLPRGMRVVCRKPSKWQSTELVLLGAGPEVYWGQGLVLHVAMDGAVTTDNGKEVKRITSNPESTAAMRAVGKLVRTTFGPMDKMRLSSPASRDHPVYGYEAMSKHQANRAQVKRWLEAPTPEFDHEVYVSLLLAAAGGAWGVHRTTTEQLVRYCQRIVREQFTEPM